MKMIKQPIYLPKGSVRAIILILLTLFIFLNTWFNKETPEIILTIWAGTIGLYFGIRK